MIGQVENEARSDVLQGPPATIESRHGSRFSILHQYPSNSGRPALARQDRDHGRSMFRLVANTARCFEKRLLSCRWRDARGNGAVILNTACRSACAIIRFISRGSGCGMLTFTLSKLRPAEVSTEIILLNRPYLPRKSC